MDSLQMYFLLDILDILLLYVSLPVDGMYNSQ